MEVGLLHCAAGVDMRRHVLDQGENASRCSRAPLFATSLYRRQSSLSTTALTFFPVFPLICLAAG